MNTPFIGTSSSLGTDFNQRSSTTTDERLLYSASAEDLDTVCWFFSTPKNQISAKKNTKSVVNFLSSELEAQSTSLNIFKVCEES